MTQSDRRDREFEELRERLSRLSAASLRINESLDFDTVIQGILDSARSLTAARVGVMTLLDDGGTVQDFLSSGLTGEEDERLWLTPEGLGVLESLTGISEPLRIPDIVEYVRALGFSGFSIPVPVGRACSFMASPIFHRGARVGHVFVGDREDGEEFTLADEEILVMFASQAALVIANARTHREERQARADLETLVNTSPVGVVVLDARTGAPVSLNREALRIVDGLREGEQAAEDLLEVVTCVRADGREVSLRELPLAEVLSAGETVRAEEIVLRVPGGPSVSVLLNASPIHAEDGQLASFVVTMQDMTPLEEMERLRAEFLAMVSHELRTPLAAVKGSVTTLLEATGELDPAEMTQFFRIIRDQSDQMRFLIGDLLDVARIETGSLPVDPEPSGLRELVDEAQSRFVTGGAGNALEVELSADLPPVMADRRRIVQVLSNLLSNAAGYSPDGSPILVSAVREGVHVAVSVTDRGRGIPAELLPELFRKFSRASIADTPSGVDGSGLGLAICKGIVEAHGGRIRAESDGPGLGARFTFTLPAVEAATVAPAPASPGSRPEARGKVRVLAVDDDPQALRYVQGVLTRVGYAPIVTGDPDEVLRLMEAEKPHLVLLDMVLPGTDGIELMHDIRKTADVPVVFLSVYGQDETVARALDMGAADYLVKPFSPTELAARIRAALRKRLEPFWEEPTGAYAAAGLGIDYARRRVTVDGEPVELTATEYALLYELAVHAPRVLTHGALLQRVWGPERVGDAWLVRDVVKRLRRKLGDDAETPRHILTEPRVGYRLAEGEGAGWRQNEST
ncbi:MAG: response regulator [Chloroflexi bacterium]|nr:response regulator [Chloroflexota bacterium]